MAIFIYIWATASGREATWRCRRSSSDLLKAVICGLCRSSTGSNRLWCNFVDCRTSSTNRNRQKLAIIGIFKRIIAVACGIVKFCVSRFGSQGSKEQADAPLLQLNCLVIGLEGVHVRSWQRGRRQSPARPHSNSNGCRARAANSECHGGLPHPTCPKTQHKAGHQRK